MFKNANGSWSKSKLAKASFNDLIKAANSTGCTFTKSYFVNLILKSNKLTGGGEYKFPSPFNGVNPMTLGYTDHKGCRIFTDQSKSTDDNIVKLFIDSHVDAIKNMYSCRSLEHSNVCGANAEYFCKVFKNTGKEYVADVKKIFMSSFNKSANLNAPHVFGDTTLTMNNVSYHSLPLVILTNGMYCAIETTIKIGEIIMQIFVGVDEKNMGELLTMRYQCYSYDVVDSCDVWKRGEMYGEV